ncbi:MAG: hypothetical protein NT116_03250, partial [Candidatus Parcubacteria bacterium]|nr:hypothetical protein [Candidatus Parcubacteria bacterium]
MNLTKPNQNITFKVGATNFELQRAIEAALPAAVAQTKDLAKKFQGSTEKDSCSKIFSYLMSDITYKVDGDNQKIKLPSAFMREKSGDCKSYSLFTGAILSNLKIPFNFTYCSYNPKDKTPEHIYVTTKKGCIIDAVYGKFNAEKKPCYKYQKPMNISYISGIKNHSEKYEIKEEKYYNIGNIFGKNHAPKIGVSHYKGIGRTGYDWATAVGIDKYYSYSEWLTKNLTPINTAIRPILRMSISKNGGGLANYLWTISPFNDTDKEDTTKKALYFGEMDIQTKALMLKYKLAEQKSAYNPVVQTSAITAATISAASKFTGPLNIILPFAFTAAELASIMPIFKKNTLDFGAAVKSTLSPERYKTFTIWSIKKNTQDKKIIEADQKRSAYTIELEAAKLKVYAKYPYIISRKSTPEIQAQYRKLETWYFWNYGGSPDDFNDAVKEGNAKTPTGETYNYYIRQRLAGRNDIGVGLFLRASISALFGYKYNPDTKQILDPYTNKPINGVKNAIGVAIIDDIIAIIVAIAVWLSFGVLWIEIAIEILLAVAVIVGFTIYATYLFIRPLFNK